MTTLPDYDPLEVKWFKRKGRVFTYCEFIEVCKHTGLETPSQFKVVMITGGKKIIPLIEENVTILN